MIMFALALLAAPSNSAPPITAAAKAALVAYRSAGFEATEARLRKLGEAGDPSAWESLGELINRIGPKTATARGAKCSAFARAASVRSDSAHNLANCYFYGDGRARDLVLAEKWYRNAVKHGLVKSRCALGNLLVARGTKTDIAAGVELCRSAAELGNADAQTDYGQFLLTGTGMARNPVAARLALAKAAAQGQGNAAFLLGQIHWNGDGTPKNKRAAATAWRQAFAGGRKDAALLLGNEALGRFIEVTKARDLSVLAEAERWYRIAETADPADAGRREATRMLGLIRKAKAGSREAAVPL